MQISPLDLRVHDGLCFQICDAGGEKAKLTLFVVLNTLFSEKARKMYVVNLCM